MYDNIINYMYVIVFMNVWFILHTIVGLDCICFWWNKGQLHASKVKQKVLLNCVVPNVMYLLLLCRPFYNNQTWSLMIWEKKEMLWEHRSLLAILQCIVQAGDNWMQINFMMLKVEWWSDNSLYCCWNTEK